MNRTSAATLTALLAALACTSALGAQRTFVASYGSDANNCSRGNPCRSFGTAMAHTDADGEVIVLDSAGYGTVTISQSVSIVAPAGIYAGISVVSGHGITVNSGQVRLKGLTINGLGGANGSGIHVLGTASDRVTIEDCTIANMPEYGVQSDQTATVTIVDTTLRGNHSGGIVQNAAGHLTVTDSRVVGNADSGLQAYAGNVTVARALVAGNAVHGVRVDATVANAALAVSESMVAHNVGGSGVGLAGSPPAANGAVTNNTIMSNLSGIAFGLAKGDVSGNAIVDNSAHGIYVSGATASARVSGNAVFRNPTGFEPVGGAQLYTPGDNYVRDNTTNDGGHTVDGLL